jgi:hypothetical protein
MMPSRLLSVLIAAALAAGCGTPPPPPPPAPARPAPGTGVQVGAVQVDPASRTVVATGFVNMVEGPVELLICGPAGKRHESVFVMQARPADLQTALLLVGAKQGPPMKQRGEGPPQGSNVRLEVEWLENGRPVRRDGGSFLRDVATSNTLRGCDWVFTGSVFEDGDFMAAAEESYVASYWDPWAVVNLGAPEGADDEILVVHQPALPPLHTAVTFFIQPR